MSTNEISLLVICAVGAGAATSVGVELISVAVIEPTFELFFRAIASWIVAITSSGFSHQSIVHIR